MDDMRSKLVRQVITYLTLVLYAITSPPVLDAQVDQYERWENGISNSWSLPNAPKKEIEELKSRWKAIEEELKSTNNDFAGTYRVGGEMRANVLRW